MPRPWKPTPTLLLSGVIHVAAGISVLIAPGTWPWALGAVLANQMLITIGCLLPRSALLGPNLTRLPPAAIARREIALTIDDGPDPEVTPHVLDLLDASGAKASFFCIGHLARQYPDLCREIVARGHSIENHSERHAKAFATFGPFRMRADVLAGQATLGEISGRPPQFFRPTAGLRNPFLAPILARHDLLQATWTRRAFDTRQGDPEIVLQRLTNGLAAGDILLLHDGNAARSANGIPVILNVLPDLLQRIAAARLTPVTLTAALK